MKKKIAVLSGDGVGPEVVTQAVLVLKKIAYRYAHEFEFVSAHIGAIAIDQEGSALPDETLAVCKSADAILFGAIGDPKYDNDPKAKIRPEQGLLTLRQNLGLYANLRPVKVYPQLMSISPLKEERILNVDMIIVRELIGGIYFGKPRKRKDHDMTAIDTSIYTKEQIEAVSKVAFDLAQKRKKKLTSIDKANVLETSRLWRETVNQVAKGYPHIALHHMFVDNGAMQLIKRPGDFDVILTENMFGDILTDEASMIVGSIGMLPSASIGSGISLYEPIHGSYPKAAGKNIANPIGTILSAAMLLRFSFHLEREADIIEKTVETVIDSGYRTQDIATSSTSKEYLLTTSEMGDKIVEKI